MTAIACPKCGSRDIYTRWDPSALDCGWHGRDRRRGREAEFMGEHLHRSCRGCQYEWATAPQPATAPDTADLDWRDAR